MKEEKKDRILHFAILAVSAAAIVLAVMVMLTCPTVVYANEEETYEVVAEPIKIAEPILHQEEEKEVTEEIGGVTDELDSEDAITDQDDPSWYDKAVSRVKEFFAGIREKYHETVEVGFKGESADSEKEGSTPPKEQPVDPT